MPDSIYWISFGTQILLGAVFAIAAIQKVLHFRNATDAAEGYGIPLLPASATAALLIATELFIAISLLANVRVIWGLILALGTCTTMLFAIMRILRHGIDTPCGCFGGNEERVTRATLGRVLLMTAGVVICLGQASIGMNQSEPVWALGFSDLTGLIGIGVGMLIVSWWLLRIVQLRTLFQFVAPTSFGRKGATQATGGD